MKNIDIFNLANAGVLAISANDLDAAHAYKVMKFKRAVRKAFESLVSSEKDALKEAGIEDGVAFDKEIEELRKTNADKAKLEAMEKQLARFFELRQNLINEDADLGEIKTIPYEQFHLLQKENKNLPNKPLNAFEDVLEGVLWDESESE